MLPLWRKVSFVMATIKYIIGKTSSDRPGVSLRLRIDDYTKIQCKVSGVLVFRQYWSDKKQCNDTSRKFIQPWELKEITAINMTLDNLKAHIKTRAAAHPVDELTKTWLADEVDKFLHPAKYEPKTETVERVTLMGAVEKLITDAPNKIVKRTGKPISTATQFQYKQLKTQLQNYLEYYGLDDVELENVDKQFYDTFVAFLYSRGFKLNSVGKHIKNIKAAINALPLAQRVACEFVAPKKCARLAEDVDNIYLTEDELAAIASLPIDTPYLDRLRDQFILLAWTGCRYSDLGKLTKENIYHLDGGEYFKLEQKKTGAKVTIPVLPPVQDVLNKYDYKLPRPMTNQKFNEYIKDVARLAGLTDEVTITRTEAGERVTQRYHKWECVTAHTARRSFATNMYKRNFPTLMIMRITGHQTEKAFLSYIKVSEDENAERMMRQFKEQEARRLAPGTGK